MSKRSRRERRRARGDRRLRRFLRAAPNRCIACAFEALSPPGDFRCGEHGPLTADDRATWRRAHPGYARAADEDEARLAAYRGDRA